MAKKITEERHGQKYEWFYSPVLSEEVQLCHNHSSRSRVRHEDSQQSNMKMLGLSNEVQQRAII